MGETLVGQVAEQLADDDAIDARALNEWDVPDIFSVGPLQAAFVLAGVFALAGALPLLTLLVAPVDFRMPLVTAMSLVSLAAVGGFYAVVGGASAAKGAARMAFWGALAMAIAASVGAICGALG